MVEALLMVYTLIGLIGLFVVYDWYAGRHNRRSSKRRGTA